LLTAESLQRRAAAADRNSCQSLALGLQADVVMVQLKAGRGEPALEGLGELQRECRGL